MNSLAWRNGNFCTIDNLSIDVRDLGFTHCDSIYEVWAIKDSKIFQFHEHYKRLKTGCAGVKLPLKYSAAELINVISTLYQQSGHSDALINLIITRGVPRGSFKDFHTCETQTMAHITPMPDPLESMSLCLSSARRIPNWAIDQTTYKNFARQDITKANWDAVLRKFDVAALLSQEGYLTECTGYNIAIIDNNIVHAPLDNRLGGITIETVRKLCERNNIPFQYTNIDTTMMDRAQDMFLTTSARGIVSVNRYENQRFLAPSELQQKIKILFDQSWSQDEFTTKIL
jgi:branched-chain amino acid aminotransferase